MPTDDLLTLADCQAEQEYRRQWHQEHADANAVQSPALHLLAGRWQASCPTCGYVLVDGRRQDRVERKARRLVCPVCHETA
jgi:hypothetical protein